MKIKITSDSTCDLSQELIEQNSIGIIPLIIVKDGEEFLDGITIRPADIFTHVAAGGSLCSTAALGVGAYQEMFERYSGSYDGIIHINIGSAFSSCYQNACMAAEDFPNVRVVDSMSLSSGQGLLVLKACELAKTALSLDALKADLDAFKMRIEGSFVVDKLDYLAKGGRCSSATALGANLLNLKPCIELKEGKLVVGKKYRGSFSKCLSNYIKDRLNDRDDLEDSVVVLTHTAVSEEIYQSVKNAIADYRTFQVMYETVAGCTVSSHCGPGTLGIMVVRKA